MFLDGICIILSILRIKQNIILFCQNLYNDKTLRITGIIEDIGIDKLDYPYIILHDGSYAKPYVTLQCYFQDGVDIFSLSKKAQLQLSVFIITEPLDHL